MRKAIEAADVVAVVVVASAVVLLLFSQIMLYESMPPLGQHPSPPNPCNCVDDFITLVSAQCLWKILVPHPPSFPFLIWGYLNKRASLCHDPEFHQFLNSTAGDDLHKITSLVLATKRSCRKSIIKKCTEVKNPVWNIFLSSQGRSGVDQSILFEFQIWIWVLLRK